MGTEHDFQKHYYSEDEVAEILGIEASTLRDRVYRGRNHPPYTASGRKRYYPKPDIRHTALSQACWRGVNLALLSRYAGVSVQTLMRVYLHARPEHTANVAGSMSIKREKAVILRERRS